jgi:hypothetical protein
VSNSPAVERHTSLAVTLGLVVLAAIFVVIAVIYFSQTADGLPSFFPGHKTGGTQHHTKHGIAAAIVALICLAGAWMSRGPKAKAVR